MTILAVTNGFLTIIFLVVTVTYDIAKAVKKRKELKDNDRGFNNQADIRL